VSGPRAILCARFEERDRDGALALVVPVRFSLNTMVAALVSRGIRLECGAAWELGGRYHVHAIAVEVRAQRNVARPLIWTSLRELVESGRDLLLDGHTRVVALRAAHALGLLGEAQVSSGRACGPGTMPAMSGSSPGAARSRSPR
jgi:hypothetical protein